MSTTPIDTKTQITLLSESKGANGTATPAQSDWPVPTFHEGLGNHPLWQALMDEIEANRQADIAELNRMTDLELESLGLEK